MANPHRGEVALICGATTYRLTFTIDALCQLEDRLDLSIVQISERMQQGTPRLSLMRALLWAGLQTHHAPINEVQAGELIGQIGMVNLMGAVLEAMNRAFGEDETAPEDQADPQRAGGRAKAQSPASLAPPGTGPASSTSG